MTRLIIEMHDLKKDKDYIISQYKQINDKTHETFKKTIDMILGKRGVKSKILRKLMGKYVDVIVSNLEMLNTMDLVEKLDIKDIGNGLYVSMDINDSFLLMLDTYRKNVLTFGLYWKFKKKGIDVDKMRMEKFIKNLGRTGKSYAKKSSYKIIKDKEGDKNERGRSEN